MITNEEILNAIAQKDIMQVMAIVHNHGRLTTAQNEATGEIVECFEYKGALFLGGNRLTSDWVEQPLAPQWIKFAVVALFLLVVAFPLAFDWSNL